MAYTNITTDTQKKRAQIKSLQDEFSTFSWGGVDAFEKYGAFIINDKKGSLKFYNGSSFSNEYSKPQFSQNTGDLLGVNFNRNTIAFTIGVYWFSIEEYREMMHWLHPLKTDMLAFGFNTKFGYMAKLSKIGDSTKYILGKENGEPRYYTELQLTFEVQGDQVARGLHPYELTYANDGQYYFKNNSEFVKTDLPTPVVFNVRLHITGEDSTGSVSLKAKYDHEEITLFDVQLQNIVFEEGAEYLNITYNSNTGILYLQYGNSSEKLLSLLTTTDSGERMVASAHTQKFFIPGSLDNPDFTLQNVRFIVAATKCVEVVDLQAECFPRTNIL